MSSPAPCFHLVHAGPDDHSVLAATARLFQLAQVQAATEVAVAVQTKKQLAEFQGLTISSAFEALQKGRPADLGGLPIRLITKRSRPKDFRGPILALMTAPAFALELARVPECTALVFVPAQDSDLHQYLAAIESTEIRLEG
jgi:hypothetical protein